MVLHSRAADLVQSAEPARRSPLSHPPRCALHLRAFTYDQTTETATSAGVVKGIGYSQRCEFSIVPIGDHDKSIGIDGTGKLSLWPEQIRDPRPFEARNPAQDCLGLTS